MPRPRTPWLWSLVLGVFWSSPAAGQQQHFKIGGGAGFNFPSDPEFNLQRGYEIGGFFGIRFNDNFSLETGFSFARSEQPLLQEPLPPEPVYPIEITSLESTRYYLDAVLLYNLGRRQPFHPFVFGGAGVLREDEKLTEGVIEEAGQNPTITGTTKETNYYPVVAFGAGFEFYILYNVAARGEWRWRMTTESNRYSHRLFFAASYFF